MIKFVSKIFCHKTIFLSGLNREFHIDLNGDVAVSEQNLIKEWFVGFFWLKKLLMTVASLLGPDKRHIKASSDIHLSFFIVLSIFFFKRNAVSRTPST